MTIKQILKYGAAMEGFLHAQLMTIPCDYRRRGVHSPNGAAEPCPQPVVFVQCKNTHPTKP